MAFRALHLDIDLAPVVDVAVFARRLCDDHWRSRRIGLQPWREGLHIIDERPAVVVIEQFLATKARRFQKAVFGHEGTLKETVIRITENDSDLSSHYFIWRFLKPRRHFHEDIKRQ